MKSKKTFRIFITLLISFLFLYFFLFRIINWELFFNNIYSYNFYWLIPTLILVFINLFFGVLRWQLLLKPFKIIKKLDIFKALILSYFANLVLPINLGDLIRGYIIKKDQKMKLAVIFGTITQDRILSIFSLLLMGSILLFTINPTENLIAFFDEIKTGVYITLLILIILGSLIFILLKLENTKFFKNRINKKFAQIYKIFFETITYKKTKKEILLLLIYSIIIRTLYGLTAYTLVKGFGYNLKFYYFLLLDVLVTFTQTISQHILGIVGSYETILTYSLSFLGLSYEEGLFIALLSDFSYLTPILIFGIYYFITEGLSFETIEEHIKKKK